VDVVEISRVVSVAVLVRRCFTKLVSPSRLFLHDTICRRDIDFGEDRRQEVGCGRMLPSLSLPPFLPLVTFILPESSHPLKTPIARVCAGTSWSL
jgi:hypothetical protein